MMMVRVMMLMSTPQGEIRVDSYLAKITVNNVDSGGGVG